MTSRPHLRPPPRSYWKPLFLYYLRIEFRLCTNSQHDWSILKFSMTSWPHPRPTPSLSLATFIFLICIPKLVSVPIFSLIRTFWNFRWRRRPRPSGHTGRQMLFDYSRHPRNSPTLANASWELAIIGKKELVILSKKELVILDKLGLITLAN